MARNDARVNITARDQTKAAFVSVQRNLKTTSASALKMTSALSGVGMAGGAAAFASLTRNAIQYGSALTDVADKLGVSVEALQEWRYAAQENGIANNAADMALQRFTRRLAEAAQGQGELKGVLEQYNIAVKDSSGRMRGMWDVLGDLSERIKKTESSGERLRMAFKAFDSEGAGLVTVLKDGREALDAYRLAAHEAGQVISTETAQSLDSMADAMERVKRKINSAWSGVVVRVANDIPALRSTETQIVDLEAKIKSLQDQLNREDGKGNWFTRLTGEAEKHTADLENQLAGMQRYLDKLKKQREELKNPPQSASVGKGSPEDPRKLVAYENASKRAAAAQERFALAQMTSAEKSSYLRNSVSALESELSELSATTGEQTEEYQNKLTEVYKARLALYNLEKRSRKEELSAVQQWKDSNLSAQLMVVNAMKNASDEMTNAFMGFVETGEFEFDQMVSSWLKSLARLTFQQGVANPLVQMASEGLMQWAGSDNITTSEGIADMYGGHENVPYYHTGGIIGLKPDEVPMVGQVGEEVLTESDPRHRNNGGLDRGESITVNLNVSTHDASSFDQGLVQRERLIVGMVTKALNRRGRDF